MVLHLTVDFTNGGSTPQKRPEGYVAFIDQLLRTKQIKDYDSCSQLDTENGADTAEEPNCKVQLQCQGPETTYKDHSWRTEAPENVSDSYIFFAFAHGSIQLQLEDAAWMSEAIHSRYPNVKVWNFCSSGRPATRI